MISIRRAVSDQPSAVSLSAFAFPTAKIILKLALAFILVESFLLMLKADY